MNHANNYPEHDRTSCSDENPSNATVDGSGCHRCNALAFDRLAELEANVRSAKSQSK